MMPPVRMLANTCRVAIPAAALYALLALVIAFQPVQAAGLQTSTPWAVCYSGDTISIITPELPGGTAGTYYTAELKAEGGSGTYYWSVGEGTLPPGLKLSESGLITGTPKAAATYTFMIRVVDSRSHTATQMYTVNIKSLPGTQLTITTDTLPGGRIGAAYTATLSATGGSGTYTWSLTSGSLPDGLTFGNTGIISGMPARVQTGEFTVSVTDSMQAFQSKSFAIVIVSQPVSSLTITGATLPRGIVGVFYTATLSASGGTGNYTWEVTEGDLPAGLTLNSNGIISGTPLAASNNNFTVLVTDTSSYNASRTCSISIITADYTHIAITTQSLPHGTAGTYYSQTLMASGGGGTYTWKVSTGELPPGLILSKTGILYGTPSAPGTYTFSAKVSDPNSITAEGSFNLVIDPLPSEAAPSLPASGIAENATSTPTELPAISEPSAISSVKHTDEAPADYRGWIIGGIVAVVCLLVGLRIFIIIRKEKRDGR